MELTHARLLELLRYDPETGEFIRIKKTGKKGRVGARVGWIINKGKWGGQIQICLDKKRYLAHVLAFFYMMGRWPHKGMEIDHIDTNSLNNKWLNLRECTKSENSCNTKIRNDNSTGHKGVSWHKNYKKWEVSVTIRGERICHEYFEDFELACFVASEYRDKYHGEFARHT